MSLPPACYLVVVVLLCKAQSLAHDRIGCSFTGSHGEREFNIAKGMCGSLITKLREPPTVTINTSYISLTLNLLIFDQKLFVFFSM